MSYRLTSEQHKLLSALAQRRMKKPDIGWVKLDGIVCKCITDDCKCESLSCNICDQFLYYNSLNVFARIDIMHFHGLKHLEESGLLAFM